MSAEKTAICGCVWRYFPKTRQGWKWKCVKRCAEHEAVREKPLQCVEQQRRAGQPFGCTFLRLRGGDYRVILTVGQFMELYREATA